MHSFPMLMDFFDIPRGWLYEMFIALATFGATYLIEINTSYSWVSRDVINFTDQLQIDTLSSD